MHNWINFATKITLKKLMPPVSQSSTYIYDWPWVLLKTNTLAQSSIFLFSHEQSQEQPSLVCSTPYIFNQWVMVPHLLGAFWELSVFSYGQAWCKALAVIQGEKLSKGHNNPRKFWWKNICHIQNGYDGTVSVSINNLCCNTAQMIAFISVFCLGNSWYWLKMLIDSSGLM